MIGINEISNSRDWKKPHTDQSYIPKQQRMGYSEIKIQQKINNSKVINRMQASSLNKNKKIWSQIICVGGNVYALSLFGPKYCKINIIQNSRKYKIAFLLFLTKLLRLTLSGHLVRRLTSTNGKARQSKPVAYDVLFNW